MINIKKYVTGPIQVNTYLVYDDSNIAFLVDPGAYVKSITKEIKSLDLTLEYIILTHGHGDHIGGVETFGQDFPNVKIVAYCDEKELLTNGTLNSSIEICGKPVVFDADIYVQDRDTLLVGNTTLSFAHTPGHTKGGMCILTDGMAFSGDTLFRASIGRTDFYGGSFDQIVKSIKERLFVLPDETKVFPGHMDETTIGYEKRNNPFV